MPVQASALNKGAGLNSIAARFALLSAALTALVGLGQFLVMRALSVPPASFTAWGLASVLLALPPPIIYLAASRLSGMVQRLRASTQALLEGDIPQPVDLGGSCEMGALADSFHEMVSWLDENIRRMNALAYTDPVTGLPNRTVISHVLGLSHNHGGCACPAAMLFIDLDGFKRINDTIGHDAGDELLRQVSERIITAGLGLVRADLDNCMATTGELRQSCPTAPVFARFAGDEFVLLLPGVLSREVLGIHADKILHALGKPFLIQGNEVFMGASIGIASMPGDTEDPQQLLIYADIAMYLAKQAGKNGYAFFTSSLKSRAEERAFLERELHYAILHDQLELFYQPMISARSRKVTGVEALVRWHHREKGMIPPEKFIAVAEQCGLMVQLGESILRIAARQAHEWLVQGMPTRISVNVSPVQFERPGLVDRVLEILEQCGVPPSLLELEITETIAMADFTNTRQRIDALRAAGIAISIDDFGTGYSNLSQLGQLNVDTLKIDRSLINGIDDRDKSEAMLTAIVSMAHALGHKVVAEGIETQAQAKFLTDMGCDRLQGYLIARPMPAQALEQWLAALNRGPVKHLQQELAERLRQGELNLLAKPTSPSAPRAAAG